MNRQVSWSRIARALPLLNGLAIRETEKEAWFWYLDAQAQIAAGASALIRRARTHAGETIVVLDVQSGEERTVACPTRLPPAIESRAIAEYQRLVAGKGLSVMDAALFGYLFSAAYCTNCRYSGEWQVCFECRYAREPVNFLPFEPEAAPPSQTASYDP